jgi:hypothetical protein
MPPGRHLSRTRRTAIIGGFVALAALLASCSSSPPPPAPSTTTTTRPSTPPTVATGAEFLSPSGNISCEIDDGAGTHQVYCQTDSPARSVTMAVDGTFTTCTGVQCLGNPSEAAGPLPYGTATVIGPFRCASATSGITCTVRGGKGFEIAVAGITAIGG